MQAPFPEAAAAAKTKLGSLRGHDFEFLSDLYTDYNVCPPPATPKNEENKEVIFDEIAKGSDFYRMSPEPRKPVFAGVDWQGDEDWPQGPPSEAEDTPHHPSELLRNLSQWRPQQEETGDKGKGNPEQLWTPPKDSGKQERDSTVASTLPAGRSQIEEEQAAAKEMPKVTEKQRNRPSESPRVETSRTGERLSEVERQDIDKEKAQASGPDREREKDQHNKEKNGTAQTGNGLPTDLQVTASQLQPDTREPTTQPVSGGEPVAPSGRVGPSDGKVAVDVTVTPSLPDSDSAKKDDTEERPSRSLFGVESPLQKLDSKDERQKSNGAGTLGKQRKPQETRSHQAVGIHSPVPADSSESLNSQRDHHPKLSPAKSNLSKPPPFSTALSGDAGKDSSEGPSPLRPVLLKATPASSSQLESQEVGTSDPSAEGKPAHSGPKRLATGADQHAQTPTLTQRKTPLGRYKKTGTVSLMASPLISVRDLTQGPEETAESMGAGGKRTASLHTSGFDKGGLHDRGLDNSEERLLSAASRSHREGVYSFGNTAQFQPLTDELEVLKEKRRKKKKKPKKLPPLKLSLPPLAINSPDDLAGAYGLPVRKSGKNFTLAPLKSALARPKKE